MALLLSPVPILPTIVHALPVSAHAIMVSLSISQRQGAMLEGSRDLHCVAICVGKIHLAFLSNKILLELANELDTP